MNNFFRALIAGWGAKKLGGGCLSTIVIFVVIYMALGQCNKSHASVIPASKIHSAVKH
jgi:hypothetical protein